MVHQSEDPRDRLRRRTRRVGCRMGEMLRVQAPQRLHGDVEGATGDLGEIPAFTEQGDQFGRRVDEGSVAVEP